MRMIRIVATLLAGLVVSGLALAQGLVPRASIVSFGLWDEQKVFQLESARGASILARDLQAGARVIARANTPGHPAATPAALQQALLGAARHLNPEKDVLVLVLTSHGSPEGIAVKTGRRTGTLAPAQVKAMLAATGVQHKVLIVSACYSGVFADALADAKTLVITAADSSHPSFGCTSTAVWTYFGQAFFSEALRQTRSLPQAFEIARASVARRERADGFDSSNPQMRGGEDVLPLLDAIAK